MEAQTKACSNCNTLNPMAAKRCMDCGELFPVPVPTESPKEKEMRELRERLAALEADEVPAVSTPQPERPAVRIIPPTPPVQPAQPAMREIRTVVPPTQVVRTSTDEVRDGHNTAQIEQHARQAEHEEEVNTFLEDFWLTKLFFGKRKKQSSTDKPHGSH